MIRHGQRGLGTDRVFSGLSDGGLPLAMRRGMGDQRGREQELEVDSNSCCKATESDPLPPSVRNQLRFNTIQSLGAHYMWLFIPGFILAPERVRYQILNPKKLLKN